MILSLNHQAWLFITTIGAGAAIGFLYDIIRIFRKVIKHNNLLIQLEDAVYWVFVVFFMFFLMLHENYGEIRFFSIYGAFMGMIFYLLTISKLINKISDTIIAVLKYIILLFLRIVFTPIRLILLLFKKPVMKTHNFCKKRVKKLLHSGKVYAKMSKKKAIRNARIILKKR